MKTGATVSPILLSRLVNAPLPDSPAGDQPLAVDYVEVNGEDSLDLLKHALALRPALIHDISNGFWLNYQDPFDDVTMRKARAMLDLARPPWLSTGIGASAEPQGHTTPYWRGAEASAVQQRERCLENIIRNGRRLADWAGIPLLLENYNYHPTGAYEYVCEPETFNALIEAIGCGVLLDLAHAQISARNLGWRDVQAYLSALPLAKVREVHVSHPREEGGLLLDRHLPIQAEDAVLLGWVLARAPNVAAVTLESEPASAAGLAEEMRMLRGALG